MIKTKDLVKYYVMALMVLFAVAIGVPKFKNILIWVGTALTIGVMIYFFLKHKKTKEKKDKQPKKIMAYKEYIQKTNQQPCPTCFIPMKFNSNIKTSNLQYREDHNDSLFKCPKCKVSYVVLNYEVEEQK